MPGGLEDSLAHAHLSSGDLTGLADILLSYYDRAYAKQRAQRPAAAVVRTGDVEGAAIRLMELGF